MGSRRCDVPYRVAGTTLYEHLLPGAYLSPHRGKKQQCGTIDYVFDIFSSCDIKPLCPEM